MCRSTTAEAVILLAHGSRDARWREPFEKLLRTVSAGDPSRPYRLAYMEFCDPDVSAVVADLKKFGIRSADVIPLFMSGGGHVSHDIPEILAAIPDFTLNRRPAIGEHPDVMAAMQKIIVS